MVNEPEDKPGPEHLYVLLADHGPDGGGWGVAAMKTETGVIPIVYSGNDTGKLAQIHEYAREHAKTKPTILALYANRVDVLDLR